MLAEWSAECAADDPVLVVPWSDPADLTRRFIDLRENPYDLDDVSEAADHPALLHALRALNAPRSPVFTAKCDVWPLGPDELTQVQLLLDHPAHEAPAGFASYLDLLWRDRSLFASFHRQGQLLDRFTRLAAPLHYPYALAEYVIRPALLDLDGPQEGFAISLYIKALAHDPHAAEENWAAALAAIVALIRSRDPQGGSATIYKSPPRRASSSIG
ncbi:hypothetical protein GCM10011507_26060 [Edaphobacter acidisoli]|uniref:Uncharacterized protein n=1 Tax=Edaphobacter acidisoli TaxID=2040573 RepID=A0A916W6V3_9BACT|nr:hypothetical protein [Edaphobacter acidisoli]GGA73238.1 hypothetical protein GCM10011507_26060 [Edaphobacter acidisoli]